MTTTEDQPVCGFGLAEGMCRAPAPERSFCVHHEGLLCGGCQAHEATHICQRGNCLVSLCEGCEHISATQHGPRVNPRSVVENEMARAVELILETLNVSEVLPSTQVQRRDAAGEIWRGLSNHIALKVLAGMAQPEKGV
jgi:hypothetical protein